jgi:hypothetical protein
LWGDHGGADRRRPDFCANGETINFEGCPPVCNLSLSASSVWYDLTCTSTVSDISTPFLLNLPGFTDDAGAQAVHLIDTAPSALRASIPNPSISRVRPRQGGISLAHRQAEAMRGPFRTTGPPQLRQTLRLAPQAAPTSCAITGLDDRMERCSRPRGVRSAKFVNVIFAGGV